MIQVNVKDTQTLEIAQRLAKQTGLTLDIAAGPKNPDHEGVRVLNIFGDIKGIEQFTALYPVEVAVARQERDESIKQLTRCLNISPESQS